MSPRSENGGGDSGGDSSGNESPTPDQEAAGTPDPRGRLALIQLSRGLASRYQIRLHQLVPLLPRERRVPVANQKILCNHFCQVKQLHVISRNGNLSKSRKFMRVGS